MSIELKLESSLLHTSKLNKKGELINTYSPFQNTLDDLNCIGDCVTNNNSNSKGLNFSLSNPVDMAILDSYDGSVNLILNDGLNFPKLINSRFSVLEDSTFQITDRIGFKDTNLYSKSEFDVQSSLLPYVKDILRILYNGLVDNGGVLKCGVYTFYFKYADADGNLTSVQGESGLVYCHCGLTNSPSSIRFGLANEATDKAVLFFLSNIDLGYTKVYVYYSRVYGNENGKGTEIYKILTPFSVSADGTCKIVITGSENTIQISSDEILATFADIGSVETLTPFSGMLLLGNVTTSEHDWDELKQLSWMIYPTIQTLHSDAVGSLNLQYEDHSHGDDTKCLYYNTKNLYYRVGYWPEEIYRFGIVYIFENGSVSPVLDILGVDFTNKASIEPETDLYNIIIQDTDTLKEDRIYEPEDGLFTNELNSKGVIRFPKTRILYYSDGALSPTPLYIKFHLDHIGYRNGLKESAASVLKRHKIKGYFIVRLVRTPNIICLGLVVQLTDKARGGLPCLKLGSFILGQSFIDQERFISHDGYFKSKDMFYPQGFIAPDAILQTPVFNDIFSSGKFILKPVYLCANDIYENGDYSFKAISSLPSNHITHPMRIINVPDGSPTRTNGIDYFSGMAGNSSEASKTSDLFYIWDHSLPQDLSTSKTLVRGLWGTYAGLEKSDILNYGQLCNVYTEGWEFEESQLKTAMYNAKFNNDPYYAVCDRLLYDTLFVDCFRGDCFISLYTHRMFRNFIDETYPTNNDIVDISSWRKNYAVRCTAYKTSSADGASFNNCKKENEGWRLNSSDVLLSEPICNQKAEKFILDVKKISGINYKFDYKNNAMKYKNDDGIWQYFIYSNGEWVPGLSDDNWFETEEGADASKYNVEELIDQKPIFMTEIPYGEGDNWDKYTYLKEPDPPKETGFALIDYGITLSHINAHEYVERRIKNINRADVNAVGLGQWVTFPICSNMNLAMRDLDFNLATEEALFNEKRAFFPYKRKNKFSKLADSYCINNALKNTVTSLLYFHLPDWVFLKLEYFNRIYYSLIDISSSEANEWKLIYSQNYVDYPKEYGSITKIIDNGNNAYIIFEHGIGSITVKVKEDGSLGLSPILIIDSTYGSMWKDSIIVTDVGVFGVDTVAKAIWKIIGQEVHIISTRRINKFLIDNIDLNETTKYPYVGKINIKSHYNKNKQDVIFTYYNDIPYLTIDGYDIASIDLFNQALDDKGNIIYTDDLLQQPLILHPFTANYDDDKLDWKLLKDIDPQKILWKPGVLWSICYNLEMDAFVTFYDWIPLESANVDNIFFTFDKNYNFLKNSDVKIEFKTFLDRIKINKYYIDSAFNTIIYKYIFDLTHKAIINLDSKSNTHYKYYLYVDDSSKLIGDTPVSVEISFNDGSTQNISFLVNANKWVMCYGLIPENSVTMTISSLNKIELCDVTLTLLPEDVINSVEPNILVSNNGVFDINTIHLRDSLNRLFLWKHGQAGIYDNEGLIKPTHWYGNQHEFNFEFVVNDTAALQKIFNNLKILSNKAAPAKFEYEVVGEGYEWFEYKSIVEWINKKSAEDPSIDWWKCVLNRTSKDIVNGDTNWASCPDFPSLFDEDRVIKKLPYLKMRHTDKKGTPERPHYKWNGGTDYWGGKPYDKNNQLYTYNCSEPCLVEDDQLNEVRLRTESLGNDMKKYGRIRGNMQYLEDIWNVEIRPIQITWCYKDGEELKFKKLSETRHRDKYMKVRIRYSGEDLAVIQAISTIFEESYT